jgi:argininosuccinate synthase
MDITTATVARISATEARAIADRVIARTNYRPALVVLWQAHDALDAVLLTAGEERLDYARKDAVLARIARAGTR